MRDGTSGVGGRRERQRMTRAPGTTIDEAAVETAGPPDAVVISILALVDVELTQGSERRHVLDAALELAALSPAGDDLVRARAEVVEECAATLRALRAFPAQRGMRDPRVPLVAAAESARDRRLEALDLAAGMLAHLVTD